MLHASAFKHIAFFYFLKLYRKLTKIICTILNLDIRKSIDSYRQMLLSIISSKLLEMGQDRIDLWTPATRPRQRILEYISSASVHRMRKQYNVHARLEGMAHTMASTSLLTSAGDKPVACNWNALSLSLRILKHNPALLSFFVCASSTDSKERISKQGVQC